MTVPDAAYRLETVSLGRIRRKGLRSRRDPTAFAALKESIAREGLLVPPLLFPDGNQFEIFDGNGRVQACAELGIESISVLIAERSFHEAEALEKALITNDHHSQCLRAAYEVPKMRLDEHDAQLAFDYWLREIPRMLVTPRQLATWLQISRRSLDRMCSAGELPQPVRVRNTVRWRAADIETWLANGCPARDEC